MRAKGVDCCAQALPQLQAKLRIERARMRLRLLAPLSAKPELDRLLAAQGAVIEYQDLGLNGQQARLGPRERMHRVGDFHAMAWCVRMALDQLRLECVFGGQVSEVIRLWWSRSSEDC